jgi:hypothetical protein
MSDLNNFQLDKLAQILTDAGRDLETSDFIFSMLFQYMDNRAIIGAITELADGPVLERAHQSELRQTLADIEREDNPAKSGLPLGSVALGAALGAAAMHFTMKPKQ